MATKKLKIGIIGTGGIARSHLKAYLNQPDVEVVAGADIVPGKAKAFFAGTVGAGAWGAESALSENDAMEGVRCYDDHVAMLEAEELDAVSVCTYNTTHAECTINALNKGIHVLLEKPMCVTTEEAVAICKAEKASGKVLSVGFQPRFDENMKMIKRIVDSGALGKVYYIQTGGGRRRGIPGSTFIGKETGGIGALGDIGCYSLDLVLNAIGYPKPLTVSGYVSDFFGKNPKYYDESERFGVDDFGAAFIRLENDIILDFRISWAIHMDTPGDTLILGTDGGLRIPSTDCWNGSVGGQMTLYHDVAGERTETKIPLLKNDPAKGDLWNQKIRSFLDAGINGTPSPIPSAQILINQAIIDGIMKSAQAGKELEIVIPEI